MPDQKSLKKEAQASFFYQPEDLQIAYKLHFTQVSLWRKNMMLILGLSSAALGLYFLFTTGSERNQIFLIFLVVYGAGMVLFHFWYHATLGQRVYKKIPEMQLEHDMSFDENHIRVSNTKVASDLKWNQYILALRSDHVTLLYVSPAMFHILPQRVLPRKQYDRLLQIIEDHDIRLLRF